VRRHRNNGVVHVDDRNFSCLRLSHRGFQIGVRLRRDEQDARALRDHGLGNRKLPELVAFILGGLVSYRHADFFTEVLVSLPEEAPVFIRQGL
jgi:hypothetical protein